MPHTHTYKGYTFRSSVEFAWAQELESRGLPWEYETVVFRTEEGSYRPDFPLFNRRLFLEIKVEYARNVHNKLHLCPAPLLLIFGFPQKCYIRIKPAGLTSFLPGRSPSLDHALSQLRKAAA